MSEANHTRRVSDTAGGAATILDVQDLQVSFHLHDHVVRAVDGVDLHVDEGETLGLVGESGCGKSVTSLAVMRLIPQPPGRIERGSIRLRGRELTGLSDREIRAVRGNDISMIFQEPMTSLNPVYSIGDQIGEALTLHRGMDRAQARQEAVRLLGLVGMSDPDSRVRDYPFQLSGGLRQRAMIAIALACEPALLIADEPTTALDVTIQAQILRLMRSLKERVHTSIIFITHDLAVVAGFVDRVVVMYAGVVVESAPVRTIFKKPQHPYTQGLLASVPVLTGPASREPLRAIPGHLPDPRRRISGCRFAERCPHAMARCTEAEPALTQLDETHQVRCFLHGEAARPVEERLP